MYDSTNLYNAIRAERSRNRMTVSKFADKIGVCEKTVRNWEANNVDLSGTQLVTIANVFGCSVDYLLGLTDRIKIDKIKSE